MFCAQRRCGEKVSNGRTEQGAPCSARTCVQWLAVMSVPGLVAMVIATMVMGIPFGHWPVSVPASWRIGWRCRPPVMPSLVDYRRSVVDITRSGIKNRGDAPQVQSHIDPAAGLGLCRLYGNCDKDNSQERGYSFCYFHTILLCSGGGCAWDAPP